MNFTDLSDSSGRATITFNLILFVGLALHNHHRGWTVGSGPTGMTRVGLI